MSILLPLFYFEKNEYRKNLLLSYELKKFLKGKEAIF
jgi:hypothetical protein